MPVLENIKNNAELDHKPLNTIKAKGAEGMVKMESLDLCIPKKPKNVGLTNKYCILCKKHGGLHKSHNMPNCHYFNKDHTTIKRNEGTEDKE